jgi:hypothetical protein
MGSSLQRKMIALLIDKGFQPEMLDMVPGKLDLPHGMARKLSYYGVIQRAPRSHPDMTNDDKAIWLEGPNFKRFRDAVKRMED